MSKEKKYQDTNAETIDRWVKEGWEWGRPISHEAYIKATKGEWDVVLTPIKPVPHAWFGDLKGKKLLGLACGGGQQIPIFTAAGAKCTVLDYSEKQLESERMVAEREGYSVEIVRADMTKPLPFSDETFDIVFQPVSNCYVEKLRPIFKEVYRILKKGGIFIIGQDNNGINYLFDEEEKTLVNSLPFNPLKNKDQMKQLVDTDSGVQFSHTLEETLGGQLECGFILTDLFEDTNGEGNLHDHHVPTFMATRAIKK